MQVVPLIDNYFKREDIIENIYVYDNGIIKGFIQMNGAEICKLYVDTSFQSEGIGNELIEFAVRELYADNLWALEKNVRAISFYQRHGFHLTGQKKFEEDTTEYFKCNDRIPCAFRNRSNKEMPDAASDGPLRPTLLERKLRNQIWDCLI